jgi:hypothetical protein
MALTMAGEVQWPGIYGYWVSNNRTPLVHSVPASSVVPDPYANVRVDERDERRARAAWERRKRRQAEQVKADEISRLKAHPRVKVAPLPPQPPVEEMDDLLLEYAKAAGISTKGYWNDRAYWRRQIGWAIKQHADRLRYK